MVYIIGAVGFIGGFVCGQMVLYFMLRHKSKEELMGDKALHWKYGLLNWSFALLGASSFVMFYQQYFM